MFKQAGTLSPATRPTLHQNQAGFTTGTPTITPTGYTGNGTPTITSPGYTRNGTPTITPPGYTGTGTPTIAPTGYTGTGTPTITPPGYTGTGTPTITPTGDTGTGTPTVRPPGYTGTPTQKPGGNDNGTPTLTPPGNTDTGSPTITPPGYIGTGSPTITPTGYNGTGTPTITPTGSTGFITQTITPTGYTRTGTSILTPTDYTETGTRTVRPPGYTGTGTPTLKPGSKNNGTPTLTPSGYTGTGPPTITIPDYTGFGSPTIIPPGYTGTGSPTLSPTGYSGTGIPTVSPTGHSGGTPTLTPTTCAIVTKWSSWVNRHTPDATKDEIESMTAAEKITFCGLGKIIAVECKTINNIPSYSAGDFGFKCDITNGATCVAKDNFPIGCQDYMIRYQCQEQICGVTNSINISEPTTTSQTTDDTGTRTFSPKVPGQNTPTLTPPGGSTATPTAVPTTVCAATTRWSSWLNRDKPTTGEGDKEAMTGEEKQKFCPGGTIATVECASIDSVPYYLSLDIVDCNPITGLFCDNNMNMGMCADYMIRYQCEETTCTEPTLPPTTQSQSTLTPPRFSRTTTSPGQGGKLTTYTHKGTMHTGTVSTFKPPKFSSSTAHPNTSGNKTPTQSPSLICETKNRWSMWIDRSTPGINGTGDHEYMTTMELQRFCARGTISGVECQTFDGTNFDKTPDFVTCTMENGLVCDGVENFPIACMDYRMRYECTEQICQTPTASAASTPTVHPPSATDGVPTVSPSGSYTGTPTSQPPGVTGKPTARPPNATGGVPTETPKRFYTDTPTMHPTGVSGEPTALPPNLSGGVPTITPKESYTGTPTMHPTGVSGEPTALPPSASGGVPTVTRKGSYAGTSTIPGVSGHPSIGRTVIPTVNRCTQSHWSSWINRDNPNIGGGDYESLTDKEKADFCIGGTIKSIECVTTDGIASYSSGEIISCTLLNGFSCNSQDNAPIPCSDYKIRYFCQCEETSSTTSVKPTPTISFNGTLNQPTLHLTCGWSPWLNVDRPNFESADSGDLETVASLKTKFGLCKNIVDISCRVAGTDTMADAAGQTEVLCDSVIGLRCYNRDQQGGMCYDYEVNFLKPILLTGIITQGRENSGSYVTSYKVLFSNDGFIWSPYQDFGQDKNFTGNNNSGSMATNWFDHPIRAQYIRVVPLTWQGVIAMRTELLGCYEGYPSVTTVPQPTFTQSVVTPNTPPTVCESSDFDLGRRLRANIRTPILVGTVHNSNHVGPTHPATTSTVNKRVLRCFEGLDISACPKDGCADGLYCDGRQCVTKDKCPCLVDGQILMSGGFKEMSNCETCQCIAGEINCEPKKCTPCLQGFSLVINKTTCECSCRSCPPGEFRCGNGECIPQERRCDGIIDCIDDEVGCVSTPMFTPPVYATATPTLPPKSIGTGQPTALPPGGSTGNPLLVNGTSTTATLAPVQCNSQWTSWINTDTPDTGDGDRESWTAAQKAAFCPNGKVSRIECMTSDGIASDSSGEIMQCTIEGGAVCLTTDNAPMPCSDFKIRYFCDCNGSTTTMQGQISTAGPGQCNSSWSSWINTDTPDSGDGDRESWTAAQKAASCPYGKISRIECRTIDDIASYSSGEIMQCTIEEGAVCLNNDNFPIPCSDYKIRYFCECAVSPTLHPTGASGGIPTVTPLPGVKTQTPNHTLGSTISLHGQVTTGAPVQCTSNWSLWINTDTPDSGDGDRESWTAAQKVAFCPHGKVSRIECRTIDEIASSGEIMQCTIEGGAVCFNNDNFPVPCSDYKIKYFCECTDSGASTSTIQGQAPTGAPVQCTSHWSSWINTDNPNSDDEDRENWTAAQRAAFCQHGKISRIECRTTDDIASYSSGEIMQCSIEGGAVCLNDDNFPVPCSDYKIKYFCECTVPPNIHTTHIHGGPSIAPCLTRWSRWINRDQPDSGRGDIEKMNAHELNVFCPEGRIKGIECVTVDGIVSYSSGDMLSCSINNGLECLNDNNFPVPCSDYKIRYYCDCEVSPLISITPQLPFHLPIHVTPVQVISCIPEQCLPMVKPVLKEGEELQTVIDANGCCFQYIVVCKPNLCAPPILNCPAPLSLEPATGESDCCLTYRCMCPTICPTTTKPVCKTTGQSWSDGVCTHCACIDKGGVAAIGYKTIARPDFCCLDCQPNGCIVNGTIYKDGATMESSKKCYDKLCIFDAKLAMFIVSETRVQCSAYEQLTDCKANEEAYDATGCCIKCLPERNVTSSSLICQTCAPRLVAGNSNHTIGYFTIMDNMEVCKNIEPIPDLLECSGFCNSRSSYSHVMQGFTNRCNCCQATGSETRNVELTCKNGRTITKSYSVPKSCGCSACSGAK
ncbi:HMCT-like protein [Mya arenaria]|uniref:HMCT-like protein n=1 Tax=Mya arenaria TaxID=6604 RepID=A0ABY7EWA8_MYAAR|nr:HMCT-like protein [Mya arenaria]